MPYGETKEPKWISEILNSLVLTISTEVGIRASWRFAISTDIFVSFIFWADSVEISSFNFKFSTFNFQVSIKYRPYLPRIFPVATPFLPRTYNVPCPNLAAYFRLTCGLLSPCYLLTIGLLEKTEQFTIQKVFQVLTFSNCQLSIVHCQLKRIFNFL